ncbi:MAG: VOC family protein [Anaerolineae bacterium]
MSEPTRLQRVIPLLQVGSMEDSLVYYQEALGFNLDFSWPEEGPAKWAQVSRGDVSFMLTIDLGTSSTSFIAEKGNGVVFYVLVEDVEALLEELTARGATIVQGLHDFGGRKQFSVADINGYVLAFSQRF